MLPAIAYPVVNFTWCLSCGLFGESATRRLIEGSSAHAESEPIAQEAY